MNSNPFSQIIVLNRPDYRISLSLDLNSRFEFYINDSFVDKSKCNKNLPSKSLLTIVHKLNLRFYAKYSAETCPYIFQNVIIYQFTLAEVSWSLIGEKILGFQNLTDIDLHSTIFHFQVSLYRVDLNERLLNKYVFKELFVLDLDGVINSIQDDLFKSFRNLKLNKKEI